MRDWIILIVLVIVMGTLGFYHAHYMTDGINYVVNKSQTRMAEPIMPPIPALPGWANAMIGVIVALVIKDAYNYTRLQIKARLRNKRSHSKY